MIAKGLMVTGPYQFVVSVRKFLVAGRSPSSSSSDVIDHDRIFRDPAITDAVASDDPLMKFLSRHWRLMLVLVFGYAVVWFLQVAIREAKNRRAEQASEALAKVEDSFAQFLTANSEMISGASSTVQTDAKTGEKSQAEKTEAARKRRDDERALLDERIKIVSEQGGTYAEIGQLYGAIAQATAEGTLRSGVPGLDAATWQERKPESADRLLGELAGYVRAKVNLGNPELRSEGVAALGALAREGVYLNASAAIALVGSASSEDEKKAALAVVAAVRERHPEQIDLLKEELQRRDISSE